MRAPPISGYARFKKPPRREREGSIGVEEVFASFFNDQAARREARQFTEYLHMNRVLQCDDMSREQRIRRWRFLRSCDRQSCPSKVCTVFRYLLFLSHFWRTGIEPTIAAIKQAPVQWQAFLFFRPPGVGPVVIASAPNQLSKRISGGNSFCISARHGLMQRGQSIPLSIGDGLPIETPRWPGLDWL
jgi:hypothetical protein